MERKMLGVLLVCLIALAGIGLVNLMTGNRIEQEIGELSGRIGSAGIADEDGGPGPGAIVDIKPKEIPDVGTYFEWLLNEVSYGHDTAKAGNSGELWAPLMNSSKILFRASYEDTAGGFHTDPITSAVLEIDNDGDGTTDHTLTVTEVGSGSSKTFVWDLDGNSTWTPCSRGGSGTPCKDSGLPPEFFGKKKAWSVVLASPPAAGDPQLETVHQLILEVD